MTISVGGVTERQNDALAFIRAYYAREGLSPSYQEIMDGLNLTSKSGVNRLVVGLEQRGLITRRSGRGRSIALVIQKCPHCGEEFL